MTKIRKFNAIVKNIKAAKTLDEVREASIELFNEFSCESEFYWALSEQMTNIAELYKDACAVDLLDELVENTGFGLDQLDELRNN